MDVIEAPAIELRDYQADAMARCEAAIERGVMSGLGVAATGLGKTVMFTELVRRRGGRALILAHRDELIGQAVVKVCEAMPDRPITAEAYQALVDADRGDLAHHRIVADVPDAVGIVKGKANDVAAGVVVASVQTASRPARLAQLGALPFNTVVTDEAHHAAADSYQAIYEGVQAGQLAVGPCTRCRHLPRDHSELDPPDADGHEVVRPAESCSCAYPDFPNGPFHLGVTATPERGDGKGLDATFTEVLFTYDILYGIRSGYLSDVRSRVVRLAGFDTSKLKVSAGDYTAASAGDALTAADAPTFVVQAWHEHAEGRKTLVFTPTVATAQAMAAEFSRDGVPAAWVSGETDMAARRELLRDFASGKLLVLVNCAVLTEGYDEPSIQCVVVARPTKVQGLYVQMIGRGLRRHPDKADCLVLDVVGASDKHSLVTVPSLFGRGPDDKAFQGDRLASDIVAEREAELVAKGLLEAREAELFKQVRGGRMAWVKSKNRKQMTQYVRQLGRDAPTVLLVRRHQVEDVWVCGLRFPDGTKRVLIDRVSLEQAQAVGEDFIRKQGGRAVALSSTDAPWRSRRPTQNQIAAAVKWRVKVEPDMTAGDLSDAIDQRRERAAQYKERTKK